MSGGSVDHASELRASLLALAERYVTKHGLERFVYRSLGHPPTVLFKRYDEGGGPRHGNFESSSFTNILSEPLWMERLEKVHSQKSRALRPEDRSSARELDSCTSSDALLMNIFCHPSTTDNGRLAKLFGLARLPKPVFGHKPWLPFTDGGNEPRSSEIDMLLSTEDATVFVESKLTERDFTEKAKSHVERYLGFTEVFDTSALKSQATSYCHYQLLRNVLAAHHLQGSFVLICDARRPDLQGAFREVIDAIVSPGLRSRCTCLTWQRIAAVLPPELKTFLSDKYGILPDGGAEATA